MFEWINGTNLDRPDWNIKKELTMDKIIFNWQYLWSIMYETRSICTKNWPPKFFSSRQKPW